MLAAALTACSGGGDGKNPSDTGGGTESPCADGGERSTFYLDDDGDGFGSPDDTVRECTRPTGYSAQGGDCNDEDPAINPNAAEVCEPFDIDEDCDGKASNADADGAIDAIDTWPDNDMDGFGDPNAPTVPFCTVPPGASLEATDCDDQDEDTFPGAAFNEDPSACMQDADGDGWGNDSPTAGAVIAGTDCNDGAAGVYLNAPEIFVDGIDQDCDGMDDFGLFDDFELGFPDPVTWQPAYGDVGVTYDEAFDGTQSLLLSGGGGTIETVTADTSFCTDLTWWFQGKRGPEQPDAGEFLYVEYYDGSSWIEVDAWEGGATDDAFVFRSSLITDAAARHPDFRLRLNRIGGSTGSDDFYVDDFFVGCPGPDNDGDGVSERFDCNDFDAAHWDDCGLCVDNDGDDYGAMCDLGDDCDDSNGSAYPGAPDPLGDGIDTNCDGADGSRLFDDFELGVPNPVTWDVVSGTATVVSTYYANGGFSAEFSGDEGILESATLDTSACNGIGWSYNGKRGGANEPEAADGLNVEYWDGTDWVLVDRWTGPATDPTFLARSGQFPSTDPNAFAADFKVRLISNGTSGSNDYFYVDDFTVQCADDSDGDGFIDTNDCDPVDALHWNDCGLCVDSDLDGFGTDCDLGPDCDDSDATVNPIAVEIPTNGVDENCDGWDRDALADDFELGAPRSDVWGTTSGLTVQDVDVFAGTFAADLSADGGLAETLTLDASTCSDVWFSVRVKRIGSPAVGDDLVMSFDDGTQWVEFDRVVGDGTNDADFVVYEGTLGDPTALIGNLRVQLAATAGGSGTYVLDNVLLTCGGDNDNDGFPFFDDCNDADDLHWADCGLCVDNDLDGYGNQCDLGFDCDDTDATRNPGETEVVGDGFDADCDGSDIAGLFDDFEQGVPDVNVFLTVTGGASVQVDYVANGSYALNFNGDGEAITQNVDLSSCSAIEYSWLGKRGPDTPESGDSVLIEYQTPAGWVVADEWFGGATDPSFMPMGGVITDPDALWTTFALRLTSSGLSTDDFYIDDFKVNCFTDGDDDGFGLPEDCDDTDPLHWADCGLCVDGDGDGYGTDCDLGVDCDDSDALINSGAADAPGDGIDTNCDGTDGIEFFDDFELGDINPDTFVSLTGDGDVQTSYFANGAYALRMGGGIATATTRSANTSACDIMAWEYLGKRGPESPDATDLLNVEYWDGTAWVVADTWNGDGSDDPGFALRSGLITDPLALNPDFTVRLFSDGSSTGTDEYYIDDFRVYCAVDADQDGFLEGEDCDDSDPAHWFDCGLCVDGDGDDFGVDCDLGPDCDDADATVNPLAPDPVGDGLDTNCDGADGVLLRDDFELGTINPLTMASLTGDEFSIQTTYVSGGTYALQLGGVSTLETLTTDTTACPNLIWGYRGKRGPGAPDATDFLYVEWWSGTTWVQEDAWEGDGTEDPGFRLRWNVITNPAAFHADFKVRFVADSSSTADDFFLDDVVAGCADTSTDTDTDGTPDLFDCAPNDPFHWSDCGACVDADGDDFGTACNLGPDCDDADATINPNGVDLGINGVDEDCDGLDGLPLLFDDLELGIPDPAVWVSVVGDGGADNTQAANGSWSLNLGGGGATATTVMFDSTACINGLSIGFLGKQGPDNPEATDVVDFYFWDGTGMVLYDSWFGGNATPNFLPESRVTTDVLALRVDAQLELVSSGTGLDFDDFFLDDIAIGCAP